MKKEKIRALSIRIPESLAKQLEILAQEEIRSINQTVIYYLKQGIEKNHPGVINLADFFSEVSEDETPPVSEIELTKEQSLSKLGIYLEQCQQDTAKFINPGAASRLGKWRNHSGDKLIAFVKKCLRGKARGNGFLLDLEGGLSLERIVLDHLPELFDEDDHREARSTLKRK